MTVAKVFAVTMAATYTATPMSRKLMIREHLGERAAVADVRVRPEQRRR